MAMIFALALLLCVCAVDGRDELEGFINYDFELAKREDSSWDDYQYSPEGIVFGFLRNYDSAFPILVDGTSITKTEADIICGGEPNWELRWGPALKWDTNRNYRYIPHLAEERFTDGRCLSFQCREGAENIADCEYEIQSCSFENVLAIWCDMGNVNFFDVSFGGAKADIGLNEWIEHYLFAQ